MRSVIIGGLAIGGALWLKRSGGALSGLGATREEMWISNCERIANAKGVKMEGSSSSIPRCVDVAECGRIMREITSRNFDAPIGHKIAANRVHDQLANQVMSGRFRKCSSEWFD